MDTGYFGNVLTTLQVHASRSMVVMCNGSQRLFGVFQ
jgi:hypothetical protein